MPQDILITPNKNSSTTQGKIDFTGKGASASTITLKVLDDSTLSFEGTAGQLFSITPVLASGTIFSVNDISGVPMIDVDASGLVRLAPLGGTVYSNTLYSVTKTVAGAGNSLTLKAGDGLTSGAGGNILLQPGLQATTGGDGIVIVRQPSGTAGTDEIQLSHDGTKASIINKDGVLQLGGSHIALRTTANNAKTNLTAGVIYCDGVYASNVINANGETNDSYSWAIDGSSFNWNQSFNIRVGWSHIKGYANCGIAYTGDNTNGRRSTLEVTDGSTGGGAWAYRSSTTIVNTSYNDLNLSGHSAFQRLNATAATTITGIAPASNAGGAGVGQPTWIHTDGRILWLYNVGTFNITLKHDSVSSTAGNRLYTETSGDLIIGPGRCAQLVYDGTSSRWRATAENYPYTFPTADGTNGQVLTTNGSGTLSWSTATGLGGSGTTNYIVKFTGSTTAGNSQIFDNGTNVGIGTASPNSKVTIGADFASITGMTIDTGNGTDSGLVMRKAASKAAMGFLPWDSDTYITSGTYYDGGAWVHHNANVNSQIFQFTPGNGVYWYASSNSSVSWNVANGITLWNNSGTWVQPVDTVGTGGSTVNALGTALIRVSPSSQNTYAALELRTLNAGTYGGAGLMAVNDTNYDSNLVFYTNPAGSTTRAERMRIHKNGDIGIAVGGKIAQGLGFAGNASATSYNYIDLYNGTTGELGLRTVGSFPLICYTANTERMRIDSSGNVGIGSNTSAYRLKVQSSGSSALQITSAGANIGGPTMDLYDSTNGTEAIFSCVGGGIALGAYSNHPLRLIVNTTERVTIDTAGNVGVGNTSPGARLQVDTGAVGTKGLIIKGAASQSATLQEWQNNSGTALASVDSAGNISANSVSAGSVSPTTLYTNNWFTGGSIYTFSRVFIRNDNLPSTVGNYIELFECARARSSPIQIFINANDTNQGKFYNIIFDSTFNGGSGGIVIPNYVGSQSASDDFELEIAHIDANYSRFRLKRTAGTTGRAFQAFINIQVGNTGADSVQLKYGTGTSTLGSTEYGNNTYLTGSIAAFNASTYSGAGRSLFLYGANGQTSGAGGSIVLQPGLQATTGGNGVVVVRAPGGTAGTDELQIYHDGTNGQIINKDTGGDLKVQLGDSRYFTVARTSNNAYYVSIDPATGISCGNHGFGVTTQNHLD